MGYYSLGDKFFGGPNCLFPFQGESLATFNILFSLKLKDT